MSSTANTFDGSAIATTRRPSSQRDGDRLVPAGERLAHERRRPTGRRHGPTRSMNSSPTWFASVRTSSASVMMPCSISRRPSGLPRLGLFRDGRVELRLREEAFGDRAGRPGCLGCPTASASSSSRRGAIGSPVRPCSADSHAARARGGSVLECGEDAEQRAAVAGLALVRLGRRGTGMR